MSKTWEDIAEMIEGLADNKHPENFKDIWKNLRPVLEETDTNVAALNDAYSHRLNSDKTIGDLAFPKHPHKSRALEGRIAALRVYALLGDKTAADELLEIIISDNQPADIKGWALYDLLLTRMPVDENCWDTKLKQPIDIAIFHPESQQVRQWAAYLLGEMGKDPCQSKSQRSHFVADELNKQAEEMLIEQWHREINLNVDRQIVISLGQIGGYHLDPQSKNEPPIVTTLRAAARHINGEVRKLVPEAVTSVAKNVARNKNIEYTSALKAQVIAQLLDILYIWLSENHLSQHPQHKHPENPLNQYPQQKNPENVCGCDDSIKSALGCLKKIWKETFEVGIAHDRSPLVKPDEVNLTQNANSQKSDASDASPHGNIQDQTLPQLFKCPQRVLNTPGLDYDSYRLAITVTTQIVQESLTASFTQLAEQGIQQLLNVTQSPSLGYVVRARSVDALRRLAEQDDQKELRNKVRDQALSTLQAMLGDPQEEVSQEVVPTLAILMEPKDGIDFFTSVVLKNEKVITLLEHRRSTWGEEKNQSKESIEKEKEQIRRRAAQGLALIDQRLRSDPIKSETYEKLLLALHSSNEVEHRYAYQAFEVIGGNHSIQALVESNVREYVNQRYFEPIDKAEEDSKDILKKMVRNADISFWFTLGMAMLVSISGTVLLWKSIEIAMDKTATTGWEALVPALSGLLMALAGLVTPFFWNSAQAVQKANGQMTNLITAFHGYLGRMRLVGLGFAHVFSTDTHKSEDANFAVAMSNAVGQAMMDSSRVLESIGRGPLVETDLTAVPNFIDQTKADAQKHIAGKSLALVFKSDNNAKDKDTIFAQDIRAGTEVKSGTIVNLTLSLGPQEAAKTSP